MKADTLATKVSPPQVQKTAARVKVSRNALNGTEGQEL